MTPKGTKQTIPARRHPQLDGLRFEVNQVSESLHVLSFLWATISPAGLLFGWIGLPVTLACLVVAGVLGSRVQRTSTFTVGTTHLTIHGMLGQHGMWPVDARLSLVGLQVSWTEMEMPADRRQLFRITFRTPDAAPVLLVSVVCIEADLVDLRAAVAAQQQVAQRVQGRGEAEVPRALGPLTERPATHPNNDAR